MHEDRVGVSCTDSIYSVNIYIVNIADIIVNII